MEMTIFEIILIGITLAMDAFALTIANCTTYKKDLNLKKEWAMPITFALFQFLMPIIGFYIGSLFSDSLKSISKFLTAGIFFVLGLKIVIDNLKSQSEEQKESNGKFTFFTLFIQGIATSIDALFIGVTFAIELEFSVFIASGIVGIITFIIVAFALFIGKSLGKLLAKYAEWAGAVILLVLTVKNLIEAFL